MIAYAKKPNVIIEQTSSNKIIIRNLETSNHTSLTDKTDIAIVSTLLSENTLFVEQVAKQLTIDTHRVNKPLKELAKRNFLSDVSEENTLFDG